MRKVAHFPVSLGSAPRRQPFINVDPHSGGALGALPGGTGPQHVWMTGAIGVMTLAVMTRASLGHAGLRLSAGRGVTALYLALIGAVLARFLAGVAPGMDWLLHLAATLWIAGFAGFAVLYWPILTQPRPDRRRASPAPRG